MPESAPIIMDGDPARDSLTGKVLGEFEIGDRVGSGGGGEVYRAQDTSLKVAVAIKRLPPALRDDALYRRRFKEEAQRAAQLGHSNRVAHVYRVLEEQNEICLIMEFVEGETLRQRLVRPILLKEFLHIASQCAEALVAAHSRGIIHGDIKPENIMLTLDGQVKILDFGVAKQMPVATEISLMERDTIDRKGTVSGTPAYMAPEVLREGVDGRADIFSLGIVFYEALTGKHPFPSEGFGARSGYLIGGKPVPASSLNPDVSKPIDRILDRMLAKKPADRYPSALELLDDLDGLRNVITPVRGENLLPQPEPKPVRKGFLLGAAAVLVAILVGWGIFTWVNRPPVLKERGWVLVSDFESVGDDPLPEKTVREGLTISLQQSRYVNLLTRDRVYDALKRMKRSDVTQVDENLGREICLRENVQVLLAGSMVHLGNAYQITVRGVDPVHGTLLFAEQEHFNRKEDLFDKVDVISRAVRKDLGESPARIPETSKPLAKVTTGSIAALQLYSQAKDLIDQGKEGQVEPLLKEAVQLDPNFAMAHMELGLFYGVGVGKNEAVERELRRAYDLRAEVTEREQRRIEANYFAMQERYEEEVQALRSLVNAYPDDAGAHEDLAGGYFNSGQVDQAIGELREVSRINPRSVSALETLVVYLAFANQPQEAMKEYEAVRLRGIDSPELHWGLGLAYFALDRLDDSRKQFREVESNQGMWFGLGKHYLARVEMYQGRIATAMRLLDEGIRTDIAARQKGFQLNAGFLKGRLLLLTHRTGLARTQSVGLSEAPDAYVQAVDLEHAGILFARASWLEESKRVVSRLESINASNPSNWNKSCLLNVRGEIALAQGKLPVAVAAFAEAVSQYPQVTSHDGLARTYMASEKWAGAIEEWQEVLHAKGELLQREFPSDIALANLQLARAYRKVGDDGQSQKHYRAFLQLWGGSEQAEFVRQVELEMRGAQSTQGITAIL